MTDQELLDAKARLARRINTQVVEMWDKGPFPARPPLSLKEAATPKMRFWAVEPAENPGGRPALVLSNHPKDIPGCPLSGPCEIPYNGLTQRRLSELIHNARKAGHNVKRIKLYMHDPSNGTWSKIK